jgi:biopolymer transport protein ExbB/TolQ
MVGPSRYFDPFQRLTSVAFLGHAGSGKKVINFMLYDLHNKLQEIGRLEQARLAVTQRRAAEERARVAEEEAETAESRRLEAQLRTVRRALTP